MSIDDGYRDKNGELSRKLSRKHSNTLVGTLRKIYGTTFAAGGGGWPSFRTCWLSFTRRP
jgi:hypothetical protein